MNQRKDPMANPCYLNLGHHSFDTLSTISLIRQCVSGEILFNAGDNPDTLYVLISGNAHAFSRNHYGIVSYKHAYAIGQLIGAHASFANICHPFSVKCTTASEVLVIKFELLEQFILQDETIKQYIIQSLIQHQVIIMNYPDITVS